MDVKNTHSATKTEISVFGRQALDAERRRSPSLADKVLISRTRNQCFCALWHQNLWNLVQWLNGCITTSIRCKHQGTVPGRDCGGVIPRCRSGFGELEVGRQIVWSTQSSGTSEYSTSVYIHSKSRSCLYLASYTINSQSHSYFPPTGGTIIGLIFLVETWGQTIKKNTNSTPNKSQTHCARAYEVTSFLSTDCELSTETTYSKTFTVLAPGGSWTTNHLSVHMFLTTLQTGETFSKRAQCVAKQTCKFCLKAKIQIGNMTADQSEISAKVSYHPLSPEWLICRARVWEKQWQRQTPSRIPDSNVAFCTRRFLYFNATTGSYRVVAGFPEL